MKSSSNKIKDLGVVYTPENTHLIGYICQKTIISFLIDRVNNYYKTGFPNSGFKSFNNLNKSQLNYLFKILKEITILDPSVGNGSFLFETLTLLKKIHQYLRKKEVCTWTEEEITLWIIKNNLYGVDISSTAIETCKLRLLEVLKRNIDVKENKDLNEGILRNIRVGNSLIGSIEESEQEYSDKMTGFNWFHEFPEIIEKLGFDICIGNPPWNILKPVEKEFFSKYDDRLSKYNMDKRETRNIIEKLVKQSKIREAWQDYKTNIRFQAQYFRDGNYFYQSDQMEIADNVKTVSGDINLYKLFLERCIRLTRPNGYCGVIIPSGIHTDAGTKGLRRLIFDNNEVLELYSFENRKGIFPSIHKSFKFDILIFRKSASTNDFRAAFMLQDHQFLSSAPENTIKLNWKAIKQFSPSSWSILEFKTEKDIAIVEKMYQFPTLGSKIMNSWLVRFKREFDVSLDIHLFNTNQKGMPIYEGKMIEQYTHLFKNPRYWIEEDEALTKLGENYKDYKEYRLGFRAVAASTNRRTMIATIIPKGVFCGNSIITTKIFDPEKNIRFLSEQDLLYLCGVFNSFIFDYLLRLKITTNLNMFFIYDMPVPRLLHNDPTYLEITSHVAELFQEYPKITSLFDKFGIKKTNNFNKINLRARIDRLVAQAYGLNFNDLKYILETFQMSDPRKEKKLRNLKNAILYSD